jgi:hypothetical protein
MGEIALSSARNFHFSACPGAPFQHENRGTLRPCGGKEACGAGTDDDPVEVWGQLEVIARHIFGLRYF